MKKRWLGMFTAGLMLLSAVGTQRTLIPVRAEEGAQVRSVNLNRNGRIAGIADPTSADSGLSYWSGDYIHFGEYQGNTIRWRVLDANTSGIFNEKETMLLLSDSALDTWAFRTDYAAADSNEWLASDVRTWLAEQVLTGFDEGEQAAIAFSTKAAMAEDETQPENRVFAPLENDRLFLLDEAEVKSAYGYSTSRSRGNGASWWTRSAVSNMYNHQGAFCRIGNAIARGCYEWNIGVVPAFNLDLSKVAFVSKGMIRKPSEFTRTEDGTEIGMWNLTLTDGSGFAAQRKAGDGTGNQVTVDVTALASGSQFPYTQISAMLEDEQGTVLAYGKISDELRTGEITFSVPEGISQGNYTLWVFEESVREDTELMQTDYASNMAQIPLIIGESGSGETGTTEPETEAPETETTEPETEMTEPETEAPETETTEPETEAPETETTEPETETTEPETEAPETETTEPETEAPETETTEPETEAPETETTEPETEAPETETTEPETEKTEPETEAPETEKTEPETEAPETKTPESENKISETGIQAPEPPHQQDHPGTKRPSRPKITKIVRKGRTFRVRWKKLSEKMSGFQIQYSTSKKFKGIGVRNVYVKKGKAVQKKITGLKSGKKYYVRVRAFRKESGRKKYSMWSKTMRI